MERNGNRKGPRGKSSEGFRAAEEPRRSHGAGGDVKWCSWENNLAVPSKTKQVTTV